MMGSSQGGLVLSSRARVVLAVLVQHADVEGVARPDYGRIAHLTGIDKNAVRGIIDELERARRIEVLQRGHGGSRCRVIE
jgi:DNA-binding IscR family transcriptional regulator